MKKSPNPALAVAGSQRQGLSRRQQLQRQRTQSFWRSVWHITTALSVLAGLVYAIRQPFWYLRDPQQIRIAGNDLLTTQDIQSRLTLNFPLTIWNVEPQTVTQALMPSTADKTLIQSVYLKRQIFPPSLTVWVEERRLLAQSTVKGVWGAIDKGGHWVSLTPYPHLLRDPRLPLLQVVGWENHRPEDWAILLPLIPTSPVRIHQVNWSAHEGLNLQTALGRVYLGSFSADQVPTQFHALAQMQDLKKYCQCTPSDIRFIDLSSPTRPTLELTPAAIAKRKVSTPLANP